MLPGNAEELTPAQYATMRDLGSRRDEAVRTAERTYREALMDYNEGITKARKAFDDAVEAAEHNWRLAIQKV